MNETQDSNSHSAVHSRGERKRTGKKTLSLTILHILMEYRESTVYQWIKKHPGLSLTVVSLWGMLIIIMFIWFVFSRVVQGG